MEERNARDKALATDPVGRLLLRLSLPAILGMLVQASYNFIDAVFIGRAVGPAGLAGVSVAFPVQLLLGSIAMTIGVGGASVVSRSLGAGDSDRADRALFTVTLLSVALALLALAAGLIWRTELASLFGASGDVVARTVEFLDVLFLGAPFLCFSMAANALIRAEGNARTAMATMLVSVAVNVALAPPLLFWAKMGMRGAAIATVAGQGASALWIFLYFLRRRGVLRFRRSLILPQAAMVREIFLVGSSEFVRLGTGSIVVGILNNALAAYGGPESVAVYGIVNRSLSISFMCLLGIAQGMQPVLGFNYGAGLMDRSRRVMLLTVGAASLVSAGSCLFYFFFPGAVVRFFTDDAPLIGQSVRALRLVVPVYWIAGFQIAGSAAFQALGKGWYSLVLSLSRQVLFLLPFLYVFPRVWGLAGVWLVFPAADSLSAIVTLFFFLREWKRLRT